MIAHGDGKSFAHGTRWNILLGCNGKTVRTIVEDTSCDDIVNVCIDAVAVWLKQLNIKGFGEDGVRFVADNEDDMVIGIVYPEDINPGPDSHPEGDPVSLN